jgi:hypothetical protein
MSYRAPGLGHILFPSIDHPRQIATAANYPLMVPHVQHRSVHEQSAGEIGYSLEEEQANAHLEFATKMRM